MSNSSQQHILNKPAHSRQHLNTINNFQTHSTEILNLPSFNRQVCNLLHNTYSKCCFVNLHTLTLLDVFKNLKQRRYASKIFFYDLDHIFYSHTCYECVFCIRDFNNEHKALFYLHNQHPKFLKILHNDVVYTLNLDAIPVFYDIKLSKELPKWDDQYQQLKKQLLAK